MSQEAIGVALIDSSLFTSVDILDSLTQALTPLRLSKGALSYIVTRACTNSHYDMSSDFDVK